MSGRTQSARAAVRPPKAPALGKGVVRTTLLAQTYEAIKERILDQTLEPGARLNIDALSRELNVSSTPIREALARLEAERLVVLELYSGYSVAPHPSLDYLRNLLDYRIVVEGHCARIGAAQASKATVARLKQLVEKMAAIPRLGTKYREYRRFVAHDGDFHQTIVDSADNKVFSETYRSLNAIILQSRLYLNREGGSTTSAEVVEEHRSILEAFEAADGERAEAAVRAHLEGGRRRLLSRDPGGV